MTDIVELKDAQDILNAVVLHVRTQGRPSYVKNHCVYFNPDDGCKCAVGGILTPYELSTAMATSNGSGVEQIFYANIYNYRQVLLDHERLLVSLQSAHDYYANRSPEMWRHSFDEQVEQIATQLKLKCPDTPWSPL